MSEQSPWGSPPPSSPFGQPTQQPPHQPSQPPTQQPGPGGGGGYGGPPYGGSPYGQGPQQPRRRTGLVIGILVAVVVVAAAFVVTLVVVSGDDEPGEASSSATGSTTGSTSEPTETDTTSETPTDPTTSTPSTSGGAVEGEGYTFDLPAEGWTDASDEAGQLGGGPTIDTVVVLGQSIQLAQSNIIVEALSAGGATDPEDLEGQWKRNLSGTDNATPVDVDDYTLDGERAIGVRIDDRVNEAGVAIKQVAYLALHDGMQYSIGLSYPADGDTVSEDDFQTLLASWRWSS